jgi:hypothetical protein
MEMLKQTDKSSIESSGFEREMSNLEVAIDCLEWVATDYQLDPNHENYHGYININPFDFQDEKWWEFFSTLHMTYPYFKVVFDHFGLRLDSAIKDEVIISKA